DAQSLPHGPAPAGGAPSVNTAVTGSSQPATSGGAGGAPSQVHAERSTSRIVDPSSRHSGVEAMDGAQHEGPGSPPPGAHGTSSTGIRQSSVWAWRRWVSRPRAVPNV